MGNASRLTGEMIAAKLSLRAAIHREMAARLEEGSVECGSAGRAGDTAEASIIAHEAIGEAQRIGCIGERTHFVIESKEKLITNSIMKEHAIARAKRKRRSVSDEAESYAEAREGQSSNHRSREQYLCMQEASGRVQLAKMETMKATRELSELLVAMEELEKEAKETKAGDKDTKSLQ